MIWTPTNPALLKVKWIFTEVRTIKIAHFFLMSGSDVCIRQGQKGFSKNVQRKPKQKPKRRGQRKLIHDYDLISHRDTEPTLAILKMQEKENVSGEHEPSNSSTGSQAAEKFPDQVCCPLRVRHSLILLVCCKNMLQFEWTPTDFFS